MSFKENLRHPIESFRTAPVALTTTSFWLGNTILSGTVATESIADNFNIPGIAVGALLAGSSLVCARDAAKNVGKRFKRRKQAEEALERNGFNSRIMGAYTTFWCDQQTAIVACEQFGYQRECLDLIAQQEPVPYDWVPHIYRAGKGGQAEPFPAPAE